MTRPIPPPYSVTYDADLERYDIFNGATGEILAHTDNECNAFAIRDALNLQAVIQEFEHSLDVAYKTEHQERNW